MKRATLFAKLSEHIEEARSMQTLALTLVQQVREDTKNNVPSSEIRIVIIVGFCQIIQVSSFMNGQPDTVYFVVLLNIFVLGTS